MNSKDKGNYFESEVCSYLTKSGYKILTRNFKIGRYSEVDIVALDGSCLVAIEVKGTTRNYDNGQLVQYIKSKINRLKYTKIKQTLELFSQNVDVVFDSMRIDVVMATNSKIKHYKNVSI